MSVTKALLGGPSDMSDRQKKEGVIFKGRRGCFDI